MPCSFERHGQAALMLGTGAGLAARVYLALV